MKRHLGEDDPAIASAAFTVTLSSEGSAGQSAPTGPTRSGTSVEAQPHSVAQEVELEVPDPAQQFAHHLRKALTDLRNGTAAALDSADGRMDELIGSSTGCIEAAGELLANTQAARKQVEEVLTLKKTAVQRALEQLLEDAMA